MGKGAERRQAKHLAVLRYHAASAVATTLLFVGYRLWRHADTAGGLLWASLVPTTACYVATLALLARHVADGGELFQPGLVDTAWDLLWVTLFVQVSACLTDWAWLLFAIVRRSAQGAGRHAGVLRAAPSPCPAPGRSLQPSPPTLRGPASFTPGSARLTGRSRWKRTRPRPSAGPRTSACSAAPRGASSPRAAHVQASPGRRSARRAWRCHGRRRRPGCLIVACPALVMRCRAS